MFKFGIWRFLILYMLYAFVLAWQETKVLQKQVIASFKLQLAASAKITS